MSSSRILESRRAKMEQDEIYALAEQVIKAASAAGKSFAFAESCTGGMLAAAITDVAGSSAVFFGSAVTYSNEAKKNILGVPEDIILNNGAVSRECALRMARGARGIYGSDMALGVTGVAGPAGGVPEKPVGTVWFAYSSKEKEEVFTCRFDGGRSFVRLAAVRTALEYLLREL